MCFFIGGGKKRRGYKDRTLRVEKGEGIIQIIVVDVGYRRGVRVLEDLLAAF